MMMGLFFRGQKINRHHFFTVIVGEVPALS